MRQQSSHLVILEEGSKSSSGDFAFSQTPLCALSSSGRSIPVRVSDSAFGDMELLKPLNWCKDVMAVVAQGAGGALMTNGQLGVKWQKGHTELRFASPHLALFRRDGIEADLGRRGGVCPEGRDRRSLADPAVCFGTLFVLFFVALLCFVWFLQKNEKRRKGKKGTSEWWFVGGSGPLGWGCSLS